MLTDATADTGVLLALAAARNVKKGIDDVKTGGVSQTMDSLRCIECILSHSGKIGDQRGSVGTNLLPRPSVWLVWGGLAKPSPTDSALSGSTVWYTGVDRKRKE